MAGSGTETRPSSVLQAPADRAAAIQPDAVNHPSHYTQHPSGIECIQITEHMSFTMGNAITMEDTNGNRKLMKKRSDQKVDNVAALIDAYIAYKANKDSFE